MNLYAERPATRNRQLLTDLLVLGWIALWVWLATKLYDLIEKLRVPGEKLESAGTGIAEGLSGAGDNVGRVPGVGDDIASPFRRAADAARSVADAGQQTQDVVDQLALVFSVLLAAVPLALVLVLWLPLRLRWVRRASMAGQLRRSAPGRDLLALRAIANQPIRRLVGVAPDVGGAWRRGEQETVDKLAALELKSLGLRPRAKG